MDKVSYIHFLFLNPLYASLVMISLLSCFFLIYSKAINKNTIEYNSFLNSCYYSGAGEFILGVIGFAGLFISFIAGLLVVENYDKKTTIAAYPESFQYTSFGMYLIIPIVIIFFIIQPNISEKNNLKRNRLRIIEELTNKIDQYIITIGEYKGGFQGLTQTELSSIITSFDILKKNLYLEASTKNPNKNNIRSSIDRINKLEKEFLSLIKSFDAFRQKQNKVYEYMNNLESILFLKSADNMSIIEDELNYLKGFASIDIIKAYNFITMDREKTYN